MKRWSADLQLINGHKHMKKQRKEESKMKAYTVDANNVCKFHLIDTDRFASSETLSSFRPLFTHQVFSSSEKIFGYTGLKVDIYLTWATLKAYLKVRYNKRSQKHDDVEEMLAKHFGENFTLDSQTFQNWMKYDLEKFKPSGKKVYEFDRICDKHRHYEVYKVKLNDKKFPAQMNRSLQAMLFFYIESASFIEADPSWNYFLLYEVVKKFKNQPSSYRLIGYWTTYDLVEGKRNISRISQFLVLPAYQKQGFGKSLVEGIYKYYIDDKSWNEISVEKPTKAFEKLWESVKADLLAGNCKAKRGVSQSERKTTKK